MRLEQAVDTPAVCLVHRVKALLDHRKITREPNRRPRPVIFADVASTFSLTLPRRQLSPRYAGRLAESHRQRVCKPHRCGGRRTAVNLRVRQRAGEVCATQVPAKPGDVRERIESADAPAAVGGGGPVIRQSSKTPILDSPAATRPGPGRRAVSVPENARRTHAWAENLYREAQGCSCDHTRATRTLALAWLQWI